MIALALAAMALAGCPHDGSLGSIRFTRANEVHAVSLATCVDRVVGKARPKRPATPTEGRYSAAVRSSGHGRTAKETIWVTDRRTGHSRPVFSETEYYKAVTGVDSPGPIELLRVAGGYVFFAIDPDSSASIAADGLILRVVSVHGGPARRLGLMLPYPDYLAWCGGRLVWSGGGDRVAIHAKRLLVARPPDWRPRPLWNDRWRSFGSLACRGSSVTVQSQRSSEDANFFATRWQLWRVGLDGSRRLVDAPPPGWADESPQWSPDGRALLFVRERNGYGHAVLMENGTLYSVAKLGYSIGYYGHHDWEIQWVA